MIPDLTRIAALPGFGNGRAAAQRLEPAPAAPPTGDAFFAHSAENIERSTVWWADGQCSAVPKAIGAILRAYSYYPTKGEQIAAQETRTRAELARSRARRALDHAATALVGLERKP